MKMIELHNSHLLLIENKNNKTIKIIGTDKNKMLLFLAEAKGHF